MVDTGPQRGTHESGRKSRMLGSRRAVSLAHPRRVNAAYYIINWEYCASGRDNGIMARYWNTIISTYKRIKINIELYKYRVIEILE